MSIRVGTIKYKKGKKIIPSYPGFLNVEVMTASSPYGELGPYVLKDEKGRIMENIWQFSKVYARVPESTQRYSRWDNSIVWQHPSEQHVSNNGELLPEYFEWRKKGMNNQYPVRYPVGFSHRGECLYAFWNNQKLDYVEARCKIYFPIYRKLVIEQEKYSKLKKLHEDGYNLMICEVDGPKEESLGYYIEKYRDEYKLNEDSFVENNSILVTEDNMSIMLNDTKHAFGHGYCLAMTLLDMEIE